MADAKLNVPITATDDTAKGVASAGKRFSKLAKDASGVGKDSSGLRRFSQSVAAMERATAKTLGGRSVLSSVGERFSAVSTAGQTIGEAAQLGGLGSVLGLATSGLGLFAGAAIAAGAAAFAFVDGWSKDAAALGRLSAATGIAAKDLDALAAAGERVGVSRDQTSASAAALGKLLNDAQYGRANQTLALENQLGLGVKRDANGTPDVKAFLLDLSDKITAQKNPYTQQEIADRFGVSALLPLLRRGRGAVAADLADAQQNAVSRDQNDTDQGQRNLSKRVQVEQRAQRGINAAGAVSARGEESALDATLGAANGLAGVASRAPKALESAVHALEIGAPKVGHALEQGAEVVARGFGRVGHSLEEVVHDIMQVAARTGFSARQMLTTARIESHFDPSARSKQSTATGLYQFLDRTGKAYGVAGDRRKDPRLAAEGYAREMQHDLPLLERRLGRTATDWEAYMLHQRGLGGAIKLLTGDQDRNAVSALGRKEVLNNGGNAAMTVGQYRGFWERRYEAADRANAKDGIYRLAGDPGATAKPKPPVPTDPAGAAPAMPSGGPALPAAAVGDQPVAKAEVTIKLTGAPDGTVTRVTSRPGVMVKVERAALGG